MCKRCKLNFPSIPVILEVNIICNYMSQSHDALNLLNEKVKSTGPPMMQDTGRRDLHIAFVD